VFGAFETFEECGNEEEEREGYYIKEAIESDYIYKKAK
jgi:hypothetical protein